MDIVIVQLFVGLVLVCGALVLLAYSVKQADHEHADRLSLLPTEPDGSDDKSDSDLKRNQKELAS